MRIQTTTVQVDESTIIHLFALSETRVDDEVLGFCRLDPDGYITTLWVQPEARGQRIGTQLIERACALMKEQGKTFLGLSVHKKNEGAQRLYLRLGFQAYTPHDDYTQYIKVL